MTDVSERVRSDIERLNDTIRRAQETIERASKERNDLQAFLRVQERYAAKAPIAKSTLADLLGVSSKSEGVRIAVREMLAKHGSRLPINEIYERLVEDNVEIGGEQPRANLANILSRAKTLFEYKNPEGWWLVGVSETSAVGEIPGLMNSEWAADSHSTAHSNDDGDLSPSNA